MKDRVAFPIRHSIRTRLLVLLLGLTAVSVVITAYLGANSLLAASNRIRETSGIALRNLAVEQVEQLTASEAQRNELILKGLATQVDNAAALAAQIYDHPQVFVPGQHWRHGDWMLVGPEGQYVNDGRDVASVFVPAGAPRNAALFDMLDASSYLNYVLPLALAHDPNLVAIYIGTEQGITWYYPNVNLGVVLPADFCVTCRPWYVGAISDDNPQRGTVWTPVYEDATGQGLLVTVSAPVYSQQGELLGVVGLDVGLQDITANVEGTRLPGDGYSFLIDSGGSAVALSPRAYHDILGGDAPSLGLGANIADLDSPIQPVIGRMLSGLTGTEAVQIGGREYYVSYAPLQSAGWSLASVVEAEQMLSALASVQREIQAATRALLLRRLVPVGAGVLAVIAVLGWVLANRLVQPLRGLAVAAKRIGAGEWNVSLPDGGPDEVGVLSDAFADMTREVRGLLDTLQWRVAERTRDLEATADVSRAAASILELEHLLPYAVDVVRDRFDLYYVGLFLLDDEGRFAVLRAGTGEFGQQMQARGHRLEVGGESMIGQCIALNETRIVMDVGQKAVRFDNPLLPATRSEMALPLHSRGRIIGAMTVQSVHAEAFGAAYVAVLETMADQVAVAIDNAQLYTAAQDALQELEATQRRYVTQTWSEYVQRTGSTNYETRRLPADTEPAVTCEVERALATGQTIADSGSATPLGRAALVTPVRLRGQLVGALGVHDDAGERQWSADDVELVEAVVERMGMVADSLRLLDQAQRREAQERTVREITSDIRSAVTVQDAVRRAISALGDTLGAEMAAEIGPKALELSVPHPDTDLSGGNGHE